MSTPTFGESFCADWLAGVSSNPKDSRGREVAVYNSVVLGGTDEESGTKAPTLTADSSHRAEVIGNDFGIFIVKLLDGLFGSDLC